MKEVKQVFLSVIRALATPAFPNKAPNINAVG
jgi:hypothetical protein